MEGNFAKLIPAVLFLGVIALLAGVMGVILGGFGDTMTQCWNGSWVATTSQACTNATVGPISVSNGCCGYDGLNLTDEYYTKAQGSNALLVVAEQQSTIAIIIVMVIIIIALVSIIGIVGLKGIR